MQLSLVTYRMALISNLFYIAQKIFEKKFDKILVAANKLPR